MPSVTSATKLCSSAEVWQAYCSLMRLPTVSVLKDVDAVVEATTLSQYHQAEKKLAVSGFKMDIGSEVICRWRHAGTGVLFDLMPTDPAILGFSVWKSRLLVKDVS
jgi:hypothetical protein